MKSANGRKRFLLVLATAARRNRIFGSEEIRVLKQCCFSWWYVTDFFLKFLFCCFFVGLLLIWVFFKQKSQLPVAGWAGVIWCAVSVTGPLCGRMQMSDEMGQIQPWFDAGCSLGNCWSRAKARLGINGCNSKYVNEVWPCLHHVYICPLTSFLHSWAIGTSQPIWFSTFFSLEKKQIGWGR